MDFTELSKSVVYLSGDCSAILSKLSLRGSAYKQPLKAPATGLSFSYWFREMSGGKSRLICSAKSPVKAFKPFL